MTTAAVEEYLAVAFRLQEGGAAGTVAALAERFRFGVLGRAWDDVQDEAGRWEHVLSPAVEERLDGVVGRPDSCPHGHPIPGRGAVFPVELHALSSLEVGE